MKSSAHSLRAPALAAVLFMGVMLSLPMLGAMTSTATTPAAVAGIPPRVLDAYEAAGGWCDGLRWELLAGIGWVESRHGSSGGAEANPDTGEVRPWIFGPPLDGAGGVEAHPVGAWLGRWGLAGPWEQAVGPMQFRPPTFEEWAVDEDADGSTDPHDIDDAVTTAANYLCGGPDGTITDERAAALRYNHSDAYADEVLAYADSLAASPVGGILCPVAGPVSFTDTWHAPRSGGRQHLGVDMFAAEGTPVVAPVAGDAVHSTNTLGGLAFSLWGDDGNYFYGAHLSAFGPTAGHVEAGTILGYVGHTGNAQGTSPHLHFETHPGRARGGPSSPVNPTTTVAAACASSRVGVAFEAAG